MQHVLEAKLAWLLTEAAKRELDARERNHVFVSIGAGESFTAIRILLKLIAAKKITLQPTLLQLCVQWLETYVVHEDHGRLQTLVAGLSVAGSGPWTGPVVSCLACVRGAAAQQPMTSVDRADDGAWAGDASLSPKAPGEFVS
jgi:hypothetical protein